MGANSKIEWTDASWTPIRARNVASGKIGWHCEHASDGCRFCYAESLNNRLGTGLPFKPGHRRDIDIFLDEKMLLQPLRWSDPRMVFVCSMTDLFADFVPDEMIDRMFAVMVLTPRNTYQILTKRPARMQQYLSAPATVTRVLDACVPLTGERRAVKPLLVKNEIEPLLLPNVWLGVSAEDQKRAEERVPLLLDTPAANRFVSAEPLIGPIDFRKLMLDEHTWVDAITGWHCQQRGPGPVDQVLKGFTHLPPQTGRLHQIITGGESGPSARPMFPEWASDIGRQCSFLTAFFHKQNGAWGLVDRAEPGAIWLAQDGWQHPAEGLYQPPCHLHPSARSWALLKKVGKAAAGRRLDGREHNGMPRQPVGSVAQQAQS